MRRETVGKAPVPAKRVRRLKVVLPKGQVHLEDVDTDTLGILIEAGLPSLVFDPSRKDTKDSRATFLDKTDWDWVAPPGMRLPCATWEKATFSVATSMP